MKRSDRRYISADGAKDVLIYRIAMGVVWASLAVALLGMTHTFLWAGVEATEARNRWLWAEYPVWTACGIVGMCSVPVAAAGVAIWIWERS
jgi:hypothetical protein